MIPNQWYAILESREVKRGKPIGVTRMGEKMVVWREAIGSVVVMRDLCPHRGVALSAGKLTVKQSHIQCPFHGFEYDSSGACKLVPANGHASQVPKALQVKTYPVRESYDLIFIWWGEPREEYSPLPWFENIDERYIYATLRSRWSNHYARAIENQLDVMHLPFVHYNTIGSGGQTLVNGPVAKEVETAPGNYRIDLWVDNQLDNNQKALKPSEMPTPQRRPLIQFCFPNIWQNWLSDSFLVFLVFAPIDNDNTLMYLRQYHTVRLPILRQLTNWFSALGNLYILNQDKRVVLTQRPKRPDLDNGEILVSGDYPIVLYRKRRRALIETSKA